MCFCFFSVNIFGQDLTQIQKDSLNLILDKIGVDDQKYRAQLTYGELDLHKLDSIKKQPYNDAMRDRIKKADKGELEGFSLAIKDSLWKLQLEIDSLNFFKFLDIVEKYGFPSYTRTGSPNGYILALHLVEKSNLKCYYPYSKLKWQK